MATVPAPRTWTASELVTAAKLNTDIRDGFNFFRSPPICRLTKSGSQSIAENATTAVTWEVEVIDRDAGHSTVTNVSRYTAQTAGWYHLRASIQWEQSAFNKWKWADVMFRKNGGTSQNRSVSTQLHTANTFATPQLTEGLMQLNVSDYVEVMVIHLNGGGPQNILVSGGFSPGVSSFDIRWVSI
ncbi:hypothetical protein [Nonomuraea sp. NPDC002799]